MIKFNALQMAMGSLNIADPDLLKATGLSSLKGVYEAYPSSFEGRRICVLLPKEVTPQNLRRMDEAQMAAKKVIVLALGGNRWERLWPTQKVATTDDIEIIEE